MVFLYVRGVCQDETSLFIRIICSIQVQGSTHKDQNVSNYLGVSPNLLGTCGSFPAVLEHLKYRLNCRALVQAFSIMQNLSVGLYI